MKYRNLEIEVKENSVRIVRPGSFVPSHIFESGQCFRWDRLADEHYIGVAYGRIIEVRQDGCDIELINVTYDDFVNIWYDYFDFPKDYGRIRETAEGGFLRRSVEFGYGLRILRQEFFETVISFIISQNNNIPRIRKIIDRICRGFGNEIKYKGQAFYSFPSKKEFFSADRNRVGSCGAGYRCDYLVRLSYADLPEPEELRDKELSEQRKVLRGIKGIGEKVADCILLYSGLNTKTFPVDIWMKRILRDVYGIEGSCRMLSEYAGTRFGSEPGIMQQYLFYYARKNKISGAFDESDHVMSGDGRS